MKKIIMDLRQLEKNKKINLLDMHNDPEWAICQLENANDNDFFITVRSSLDAFLELINEDQKQRFEKVKIKLKKIIPNFFD